MKKIIFYIYSVLILFVIFFFTFSKISFAAYPKLISILISAFESIESWLIKISTPAAAVAVGTGIFMKKFSFGDEERLRMGKKIIRGSLFSYAFLLSIDLILSTINLLLT